MYILATLLLIISIIKIIFISSTKSSELPVDFEYTYKVLMFILIVDGSIGLICSLFILLW